MDKVTSPVKKTPSPLKRPQQLQKKQLELVEDNKPELTQDSSGLSKISRDDPLLTVWIWLLLQHQMQN